MKEVVTKSPSTKNKAERDSLLDSTRSLEAAGGGWEGEWIVPMLLKLVHKIEVKKGYQTHSVKQVIP